MQITTIQSKIHQIRGIKVMLDFDLAKLYQVPTKSLNLAVKRNLKRFPEDFMFQLTKPEFESLRFQNETSNNKRGGTRYHPYAFTEQGIAMLSSVLNSDIAIEVNIQIIRTFVMLRQFALSHKELTTKLKEPEWESLRFQFETLETGRGKYPKYLPYAFTEQGLAMLSGLLHSEIAIEMNISIMRAFVLIRQFALSHMEITAKLKELEKKYDQQFNSIAQAIDYLLKKDQVQVDQQNRKKIGFK